MMTSRPISVGIIVNPASGTDIRRLVALGTVFGAQEKINILQRVLTGLDAMQVEQIYLMPDGSGLSRQALARLPTALAGIRAKSSLLDMPVENSAADSIVAARKMQKLEVGCIIVLGGDGTNRVVAKGCGDVPILPLSSGTNNVVPYLMEGTVAGFAAGFVARFPDTLNRVAYRSKRLEICRNGQARDHALVDIAVVVGQAIASRAVWEADTFHQIILTRGEPNVTGVSSLGGLLKPLSPKEPGGLFLQLGEPRICRLRAPIAPGLIRRFNIEEIRDLATDDMVTVGGQRLVLALDGEREIVLGPDEAVQIALRADGPLIVDISLALAEVARQGFFVDWSNGHNQWPAAS
jgi:hypothetical protein